jgi:hypothetical protein
MSSKAKEVEWIVTEKGCHEVISHKPMKSGYIPRRINGQTLSLHRLVYEENYGKIPKGLVVRHKCDNRACINPEHLEIGTFYDNAMDRVKRNRQPKGEEIHQSKLTEEQARDIKYNKELTQAEFVKKYNVTSSLVSMIINGKRWKHI